MNAESDRGLYRDADRAVLGGVCAGLASYLGFNLKVTRLLAFIAFLMAMPIAIIAYLAAVFLIPSVSRNEHYAASPRRCNKFRKRKERKARKKKEGVVEPISTLAADINRRCESMDERLARLEKHVTSRRFQIEQELERL
jgi:phage shock protein C